MGGAVFPPCCLTWGQTMVEVMKMMATSFKRSCVRNVVYVVFSALNPAAGHCWSMPLPETPGHSQRSLLRCCTQYISKFSSKFGKLSSGHRTGETDSWRAQTKPCVHQDPGERSSDHTRDWPRLAHECSGVSGRGVGWWWPAAESGALSAAVHAWKLLKEVAIIFITSTIVWLQVKQQEGNTAPSINTKLD